MPFKNSISGADLSKQNGPVPDPTKNFEPHKNGNFVKAIFLLFAIKIMQWLLLPRSTQSSVL